MENGEKITRKTDATNAENSFLNIFRNSLTNLF